MLLIDGISYIEWAPKNEDEFEQVVKEHSQEIFGKNSIYIDIKHKIKSEAGIGSIPDGYVIILGNAPRWNVVEVELSSHNPYDHIVSQIGRFIKGIKNPLSQQEIIRTIYNEINKDSILAATARKEIASGEIHEFISECVLKPPEITIVIEKRKPELDEAIETLAYCPHVVELRTFTNKVLAKPTHAHLFNPLNISSTQSERKSNVNNEIKPKSIGEQKRVTVKDLVDSGFFRAGQIIYRTYKNQRYEGKVLNDGGIELVHTGKSFDSLSDAAKDIAGSVNGWIWWYTKRENGAECLVEELRKEYRTIHTSNT
jgi:hypothetical protein